MRFSSKKVQYFMAVQCLTQVALAERSGLTRQTVGMSLAKGSARPETVASLARGLDVDVSAILED